ncbi:HAD hydrolase-like protein [candidate division KSB3 bacterium]|uniref:HAD hydrolase-like protein n=1 Tax=candidate division KSB3 bacterium TaxID=2044937 RepID=A0A9D5JSJ2_9BACT|nr:HAD hydrolase-like protein [candidate division KSB3 bacterium]MBD3323408.1 HAD hydrolase-like protein [candidate division KSB3 bacterium]
MIHTYKHIVWDWNGTLFNDVWLCVETINTLLSRRRLPTLSLETYRRVFLFPVRDYYREVGFDFAQDSFEDLSIEFMQIYHDRLHECTLHQDVQDVLTRIKRAAIGQSILSAFPYDSLVKIVRQFQLEGFFDHLLGLGDIYADSKIELGRTWMHAQGYGHADVLLIGDTTHDFDVAEAIGADCILVASGHNSLERLQECRAVRVVESLADLMPPEVH